MAGYGVYDGLDDATSSTIIQIQIEDINQLIAEDEQRQSGVTSDWTRTLTIHRIELTQSLIVIRDRRVSSMLAVSLARDVQAVSRAVEEERQAETDHTMACRLGGVAIPSPRPEFANRLPPAIPRVGSQGLPPPPHLPTPPVQLAQAPSVPNQSTEPSGVRENISRAPPVQHTNRIAGPLPQFGTLLTATASSVGSHPAPAPAVPHSTFDWNARPPIRWVAPANAAQQTGRTIAGTYTNASLGLSRPATNGSSSSTPSNPRGSSNLKSSLLASVSRDQTSQQKSGNSPNPSKKRSNEDLGELEREFRKRLDTGNDEGIGLNCKRAREENSDQQGAAKCVDKDKIKTSSLLGCGTYTTFSSSQETSRKRDRDDDREATAGNPVKRIDTGVGKKTTLTVPATTCCVSCGDDILKTEAATVECSHEYCRECLQTVVRNALVDEALYPPRCCRLPFTMDSMRDFLTPELISDFHEKRIEFGTRNRTYCSNPHCSAFLHPINIEGEKGDCPMCFTSTCILCKGASHKDYCPKDEGVQQVLVLGAEKGWKQCNRCNRMIELKVGCNHITCPCKAEWCYVCGVDWKHCACPQWDEQRLLERAEQDINRRPPQANIAVAVPRPQQIVAQAQYLRTRHECYHEHFQKIGGWNDCDECGRECRRYINQCVRCHLLFCYGCKLNRLY